jgi:hypothetical protein
MDERGTNRYGLDMSYLHNLFKRELTKLRDYRPDELARVLARAAVAVDAAVLEEDEFHNLHLRVKLEGAICVVPVKITFEKNNDDSN